MAFRVPGSSGSASLDIRKSDHIRGRFATTASALIQFVTGIASARLRRRYRLAHLMHAPPVHAFQQRRQLRRRQSHYTILDLRPAEDTVLEPLGEQAQARAIPEHQLDPIRTLCTEHIYSARERIGRHDLANQRGQTLGALAEVDRPRRNHHPDRARRANHAPAFSARSTIASVAASAPRPMRIFTSPISTSIVPATVSTFGRDATAG